MHAQVIPGEVDGEQLFSQTQRSLNYLVEEETNNRMELMAVIEGLDKAIEQMDSCKSVFVYSDSAYVINAINNKWIPKWVERSWRTSKR